MTHLEGWEVLDLLAALVDKSLVIYEENSNGVGRYRLLQMTQQYAQDRLREENEQSDQFREQHLDYYLALAEEAEPKLLGAEQAEWLGRLETEHDNLRAALEWSRSAEQRVEAGLRIAGAIWRFWYVRGHFTEGRRWFEGLLAVGCGVRGAVWANALNRAGVMAAGQDDYGAARRLFEESLALRRESGDTGGIVRSLNNMGIIATRQGDYAAAQALFEEGLAIARELGDKSSIAMLLDSLGGHYAWEQGTHAEARALLEESLTIQRELGDKPGIAGSLNSLGRVACSQGDYGAARRLQEECLSICQDIGYKHIMSGALNSIGDVAYQQGDWAEARAFYKESLTLRRDIGEKKGIAESLEGLAKAASRQGQIVGADLCVCPTMERAARLCGAAKALREAIGAPLRPDERADYDRGVAAVRAALGEEASAAAWAEGRRMTLEQAVEYALGETDSARTNDML